MTFQSEDALSKGPTAHIKLNLETWCENLCGSRHLPSDDSKSIHLVTQVSRNNRQNLQAAKYAVKYIAKYTVKYIAKHVIDLFFPTFLCMIVVVATISSIPFYNQNIFSVTPYTPLTYLTVGAVFEVWQSFAIACILLAVCMPILVTLLLVKFNYVKVIPGVLKISSLIVLFLCAYINLREMLRAYNIPMDYITIAIIMWNFGVVGMVSIHWKGPLILHQAYLILASAFATLCFIKVLPNGLVWAVLGFISVWDLVVSIGLDLLGIRMETDVERNAPIFPALIYSSGEPMNWVDCIFYSLLVGKVATFGVWITTIACFVAILLGMFLRILLLALFETFWGEEGEVCGFFIPMAFGLISCFITSCSLTFCG